MCASVSVKAKTIFFSYSSKLLPICILILNLPSQILYFCIHLNGFQVVVLILLLWVSVRKLGPLSATPQSGAAVEYVFSVPLAPGESVTLVPSASSLLFTPMSAAVVGAKDCVQGVEFNAERGQVNHMAYSCV